MKIEKLSKDNVRDFINDIDIDEGSDLINNVNKKEIYGVKDDDKFILGFDSLSFTDTISIIYYNEKITDEKFYECIDFLNNSLVVDNHLIIEVFDDKCMSLFDSKYRCKEILAMYGKGNKDIDFGNVNMKEDYADIGINSIKYVGNDEMVSCNLVKQNIQDEKMISDLHEYFVKKHVNIISFIVNNDIYDFIKDIGYKVVSKSYIIKDM